MIDFELQDSHDGDTDYAVPPGETLDEFLEENGMSQREFARRVGLSAKHVNRLVHGIVPLSADVADRLERVTGISARMWNRLEADYRSDLRRIRDARENERESYEAWIQQLKPSISSLVKFGILDKDRDFWPKVDHLLGFFRVASLQAWKDLYDEPMAAFRQSDAFDIERGSVATWTRLGEISASEIKCDQFDRNRLLEEVQYLRSMTREPVDKAFANISRVCADNGVAVVFVPEVPKSRASGVTKWLGDKFMIALTCRGKSDDKLWFTFFHELGHVLLHGGEKKNVWVQGSRGEVRTKKDSKDELEADEFARETLIPGKYIPRLKAMRSKAEVLRFAEEVNVAPSIVVGRLQYERFWPQSWGAGLKRRVEISEEGDGVLQVKCYKIS